MEPQPGVTLKIVDVEPQTQDAIPDVPDFEMFWACWPRERRVCKKETREVWGRLSAEHRVAAMVGLAKWIAVWEYRASRETDAYGYVQQPQRWLRNERWEDELPAGFERRSVPRQQEAKQEAEVPRTAMPQHVKDMIARMREKR